MPVVSDESPSLLDRRVAPRTVPLQFDMRVLNTGLPVEIEGTCNQRPFYYRARGGTWRIFGHVVDSVGDELPFASGECDVDEQVDLGFALDRIYEYLIEPEL